MTTTTAVTGAVLAPVDEPLFGQDEQAALTGFLAGYSGLTRDAYTLDLRMYSVWCGRRGLHLFTARRADIECFGRYLETAGRARATIARRLCTIAGFYRYAVEEDLLEHSPAAHVRRPPARLRVARGRVGSQRGRRAAGRRRAGCGGRARPDLAAGN
jgi:integrase/recombinase XerD